MEQELVNVGVLIDTKNGLFSVSSVSKASTKPCVLRDHARMKVQRFVECWDITTSDIYKMLKGEGVYFEIPRVDSALLLDYKRTICDVLIKDYGYTSMSKVTPNGSFTPSIHGELMRVASHLLHPFKGECTLTYRDFFLKTKVANDRVTENNNRLREEEDCDCDDEVPNQLIKMTKEGAVMEITTILTEMTDAGTLYEQLAILGEVNKNLIEFWGIGK